MKLYILKTYIYIQQYTVYTARTPQPHILLFKMSGGGKQKPQLIEKKTNYFI